MKFFKVFMNKQQKKSIVDAELKVKKQKTDEYEYKIQGIKEGFKYEKQMMKDIHNREIAEKNREIYELEKKNKELLNLINRKFPDRIADYKSWLFKMSKDVRFEQLLKNKDFGEMQGIIDGAIKSVEDLEKVSGKAKKDSNKLLIDK